MNELTDTEKWEYIKIQITKDYPKLVADAKRITSYNAEQFEDLLPFCITELLTKKPLTYLYKLIVLDKALPNYMGKSMSLNIRSSTSPFWSKYRKQMYNNRGVYLAETEDAYVNGQYDEIEISEDSNYECMMEQPNKMNFYNQAILTDYFIYEMTDQQLNKKYGISLNNLRKAVDEGLAIIRDACKQSQTL